LAAKINIIAGPIKLFSLFNHLTVVFVMNKETSIRAFAELGHHLRSLSSEQQEHLAIQAASKNPWFDKENVVQALRGIAGMLEETSLREWISRYTIADRTPRRVGVVMAGNVPMVGFHDMLCVLVSGHYLYAKLSSEDPFLLTYLADKLISIEPAFEGRIRFVEMLKDVEAVIATGSDNTARYFEYYFAQKPHIIRRNRSSLGILNGKETIAELQALGQDILQYYGLGCRNVSKVMVPEGYEFDSFFIAIEDRQEVRHHHKYRNNYDYQKSILLVNKVPHFDNGFLCVTQSTDLVSPISVLFYDTYQNQQELEHKLSAYPDKIQVIVSAGGWYPGSLSFGQAQCPTVMDYADGVDTMAFLEGLA
jgi:hypothetical protein